MSIVLNISPAGLRVQQIPGEDGETAAWIITFHDPAMAISVGPFDNEEWDQFKGFLADPEEAQKQQETRAKILSATGQPLPKMTVPKG